MPSGYCSPSLTTTSERLRRSDRIPADRNGSKITHNRTGDGTHSRVTDRNETDPLRREMCHRRRHGALDDELKKTRYSSKLHDGDGIL